MITRIKLTQQDMTTYIGFKWTVGEWKETDGTDGTGELCGPRWLHCYRTPLLAVLHNPIHAGIKDPLGWTVEVDGECREDGQMKEGWTRMRLLERIELPEVTPVQLVAYGILCALEVENSEPWRDWAARWLSGEDRSIKAARAEDAENDTWSEARAAARAARAAVTENAERAADAAEWAAARCGHPLDLIALSEKAMAYK